MNAAEPLIVGVDAGASSVAAAASLSGEVRGGSAGPASVTTHAVDAAADAVLSAVREATRGDLAIAAMYVGAAGAGRAALAGALAQALRARLPRVGTLVVEDDARIALRAAIPEGAGVVVIAGTGSVAYAENAGERFRVGGAGFLLGDEGSAYAIGLAAVRLLGRAFDGRERHDDTTRLVARAFGVATRDDLLDAVYVQPGLGPNVARIAALAPEIIALAADGNRASSAIVKSAANDLTQLVEAASRRASLDAPRVALAGGLLKRQSELADMLRANLTRNLPGCSFSTPVEEPELTALRFARGLVAAGLTS